MSLTVGDVLKVVAVLQWVDGDIMQNVFNIEIVGSGGPFDPGDVVDDMVTWMDDVYGASPARVSDDVDGSEVRVYVWDAGDQDWDEVGIDSFTFLGTDAADVLPRGVALLINAKSLDPDVNGKKYFGGATEVTQTDGLWTAAMIASYVGVATEWVQNFTGAVSGADFDPGIWSVKQKAFHGMSNTIIIPSIPAYQRRRKQGVGI